MIRSSRIVFLPLCLFIFGILSAHTARAQSASQPELPRTLLDTTYVAPMGNTITVAAGGNLQAALNAANPGDVIVLEAGATFIGNFTLPMKPGSGWVVIRSALAEAQMPPAGSRVTLAQAASFAKLVTPNADPVLRTAAGAHHYRLVGIEFTVNPQQSITYDLIRFGAQQQTALADVPHDLVIDRCYVHGNPGSDLRRGVALNSARTAIIDSHISDCHERGADSQAIAGWNGPGPFKIVNNYLEGAGENVMFGGTDPKIINLVPADIEFRRNHLAKPLSWNPRDPSYAGRRWSVKNIFELKNARRVLVDGNVFENNWVDGQNGTAILFTVRNQEGSAPWCIIEDVTFTNNIVRNTAAGVNFLGEDYNYPSQQLQRVKVQNNLFVNVGGSLWGGGGVLFYLLDGTAHVTIDHNTAFHTGNIISADGDPHTGFVYTNNLTAHNDYGVIGAGYGPGRPTLNNFFPGYVFTRNLLAGGTASAYPANNFFPATLDAVGFVDRLGGNYRLADTSPYRNAGTDGKDVGADIAALEAALAPPTSNQAPAVSVGVSTVSGTIPLDVAFTCNASDPDGQVVAYDWDFGDGHTASSPFASHTYQTTGTFTARLCVTDNAGATATATVSLTVVKPPPPFPHPTMTPDIVLYAAESQARVGNFKVKADPTAAGGARLANADLGGAKLALPLANPKHYFEMTFHAQAGIPYRLWVRGKADNDSPYNDSFFVQFSSSTDATGAPVFRTGTTSATAVNLEEYLHQGLSGWGWQDNGWGIGTLGDLIYFQSSGVQTLRIQPKEDGFSIDQIVLSPRAYLHNSPGVAKNDSTILPNNK